MIEDWTPKTDLGRRVLHKEITNIDQVLNSGQKILEPQIIDVLLPEMDNDLLMIGQSKGKFGGGRRRVFRQTQKKTREGNKPRFAAYAVVGNKDGYIGLGYGKARETVPAREKALRQAKINVFKIARGSGSWESQVDEPHTVPFRVSGQCGSVKVVLIPAPKGKGLVAEKEIQKILELAGIKDVWSRTFGQTKNKINLIKATEQALKKLVTTKISPSDQETLSVTYGSAKGSKEQVEFVETMAVENKPAAKPQQTADSSDELAISDLPGVGPSRVQKLSDAGITSVAQLASASPEDIADMSESTAKKLIDAAQEALK